MEDPALKLFAAEELLGGSTERTTSLFQGQGEQFDETREKYAGASQESIEQSAKVGAALDTVSQQASKFATEGLGGIITGAEAAVGWFRDTFVPWFNDNLAPFFREIWEENIKPVFDGIQTYWTTVLQPAIVAIVGYFKDNWLPLVRFIKDVVIDPILLIFSTAWDVISSVFGIFAALFTGNWTALWDNVKTLLTAPLKLVVGTIKNTWEAIQNLFTFFAPLLGEIWGGIWTGMLNAFRTVKGFITNLFKSAVNGYIGIWEGLANAIIAVVNRIIGVWNGLEFSFPGIAIPFAPDIPGFTVGLPDIPTLPNLSIPRLAQGGIVSRPTLALIGESGPEAVVPLGRGRDRMGGGNTYNLYITAPGDEFLRKVKDVLVDIEREGGYAAT